MTRKKNAGCPPDCLEPASRMADAVRSVIRTHFRKHMAVDAKADSSPVMIAAREAEAMMQRMIVEAFPEHGIPGEEFGAYQPDADWVWALDPIDSTKSFISGSLAFGTQIALLHQGVPVLGTVDRANTEERWIGRDGLPTLFNGAPIGTSKTTFINHAIVYTALE